MSFGIEKLLNVMKGQAIGAFSTFSQTRLATISNYNKDKFTARVLIQPENILTAEWPILTSSVGNGWGIYIAPNVGDQVIVHFQEGDFTTGLIGQRVFNSKDLAINPGAASGEMWMIHKTGSYLKFHNDGTIEIKTLDANGNPTNLNIISNIVVTGNITASGDILDNSSTNTNTMKLMRSIYDSHTHGGVMVGGGNTAVPNQLE